MPNRIKNLIDAFAEHKIDALVVTKDVNIKYLTGFPASESWLFVTPKKSFYITDFRYILEARKGLKDIPVKQYTQSIAQTLFEIAVSSKIARIGFDEHQFSVAQFKSLKRKCPKGIKLTAANNMVEQLRTIKDREEIKYTREALKLHAAALKVVKKAIKPNVTEQEVFLKLERFVKAKKVGFSFDPIIASGANSCFPHAHVTTRKIRNNEPVLVDMGIDYKGYKSDLTRMFFLGKIPQLVRQVNDTVQKSQWKAIEMIQPGALVRDVDRCARGCLAEHRLDKYFGHALGHGVGLEIHEAPRLSEKDPSKLEEGMIVTVEPAVYIPKKFGIRIEDMILVTKEGCEVLSDNID